MPDNILDSFPQTVSVSGGPSSAENPYSLSVLAGATYTVSISERIGYTVGYTLCIDNTSCHSLTPTPGNTATVVIPSGKLSNTTLHYADLWWHYTPNPTLDFSLSDGYSSATIIKGSSIVFTWTVANATACTASATPLTEEINWSGAQSYTNGTFFSQPIIPTTIGTNTYNLQCFNIFSIPTSDSNKNNNA
ncbi:MAG TPA: hypothetical protein DCS08_03775 [Candidatus Moranbacteria bacterium]|nr:hypothetical protein [Candidatus Moranbacteria bacterium]HBY10692.1 hypothetical protein [Candidatus Moranbacteria bacterium]